MDLLILNMLMQGSVPMQKAKAHVPTGTEISYSWYGKTVHGKIVGDSEFPMFQTALLEVQGVEVMVIVDPNKCMV